ncbi:DUF5313 family protein [Alloactinosynnema sp. L-07]|uniref:DUF5313 family protein n=1 Tax=Alloactinosynnema sp. L-07 TaxID=1653480 RepID=UPI0009ECFDAE|nr:DUF5313 family protein [Alloactinosynnema sp. L-07]
MTKPSAPRRLWHLLGGRLPMSYREWVFADATGPKWIMWFTVRAILRALPLSAAITLTLTLGYLAGAAEQARKQRTAARDVAQQAGYNAAWRESA